MNHSRLDNQHNWKNLSVNFFFENALLIIMLKSREVQFSFDFLLMLHHKFGNATHVMLRISNWQKLENMKRTELHPEYSRSAA